MYFFIFWFLCEYILYCLVKFETEILSFFWTLVLFCGNKRASINECDTFSLTSIRPRIFLEAGFRPRIPAFVWYVPLTPNVSIFDFHPFEWAGVDIRWVSVDGFDTCWIPGSFSCGTPLASLCEFTLCVAHEFYRFHCVFHFDGPCENTCCSVLQCVVAVCCSVLLQCVAVCCSVLLQCVAVCCCSVLQCVAVCCCSVLHKCVLREYECCFPWHFFFHGLPFPPNIFVSNLWPQQVYRHTHTDMQKHNRARTHVFRLM